MSILIALLIGALVGATTIWILPRHPDLIVLNILVGIVGALLGLAIYFFSSLSTTTNWSALFSPVGTLCSLVGALLLVALLNLIHRAWAAASGKEPGSAKDTPTKN